MTRQNYISVPCPTCGAQAGHKCQWGDIAYIHRMEHAARRKAFNELRTHAQFVALPDRPLPKPKMSACTVTEDKARGWWSVMQDGIVIDKGFHEEGARREARRLNLNERAEAMLDLLLETLAENRDEVFPNWDARRDALIEQITGESENS